LGPEGMALHGEVRTGKRTDGKTGGKSTSISWWVFKWNNGVGPVPGDLRQNPKKGGVNKRFIEKRNCARGGMASGGVGSGFQSLMSRRDYQGDAAGSILGGDCTRQVRGQGGGS